MFDSRPIPAALFRLIGGRDDPLTLLNLAAGGTVLIALLQAVSAYLGAFYAVSIGQWIAHDLRQSVYAHLQRLSMSYDDRQQVGPLIGTITDDINAVQDFASTSLLDLVIDSITIIGIVVRGSPPSSSSRDSMSAIEMSLNNVTHAVFEA